VVKALWSAALVACPEFLCGQVPTGNQTRGLEIAALTDQQCAEAQFERGESAGLFVGVRTFLEPDGSPSATLSEVPYSVDDAIDLAYLFSAELRLVPPTKLVLALGGEPQKPESNERLQALIAAGARPPTPATYVNLRNKIREVSAAAGARGLLVMSFATHGLRSSKGDDCLLAQDSLRLDLDDTTLSLRSLTEIASQSTAPRRILLFDTCRERVTPSRSIGDAAALSETFTRAIAETQGTFWLCAAPIGGYSYDDPQKKNGVFTAAVLAGLHGSAAADKRGFITLDAMASYVEKEVKGWVQKNRQGISAGEGIERTGNVDFGSLPLAVSAQTMKEVEKERQRRERLRGVLLEHIDDVHITGEMYDQVARIIKAEDARDIEPLLKQLEVLEKLSESYVEMFSDWWNTTGRKLVLSGQNAEKVPDSAERPPTAPKTVTIDFVLTGSSDGTARLWSVESSSTLHTLEGHADAVRSVALSRDGKYALTGSGDQTVLWDAQSAKELGQLEKPDGPVWSVAFSPDGKLALTGSDDGKARLWDLERRSVLQIFTGHSDAVYSVAFSENGKRVLTGSGDHTARVWDAASGSQLKKLEGHSREVRAVAFSPDGRLALTGSDDMSAWLWDVETGQARKEFREHSGPVWAVAFSPDGERMLTGSQDKTARIWNSKSGAPLHILEKHMGPVTSVAFSQDGKRVLTGSVDFTAVLWDAQTGEDIRTFTGHKGSVLSVSF
jgi:hypothetical protein